MNPPPFVRASIEGVDAWLSCWPRVRSFAAFCEDIDNAKRSAVEARKRLASATRDHRRLLAITFVSPRSGSENAIANESLPIEMEANIKGATEQLLKEYQAEVDSLTRRAKAAESSFISLLQLLLEQPDLPVVLQDMQKATAVEALPIPTSDSFSNGASSALQEELEAERLTVKELACRNAKLEKECSELEAELSRATNQTITIRKLEQQLQQRKRDFDEALQSALLEKEKRARSDLSAAELRAQRQVSELSQTLQSTQEHSARLEGLLVDSQHRFLQAKTEFERKYQALVAEVERLDARRDDTASVKTAEDQPDYQAAALRALQVSQDRIKELMAYQSDLEAKLADRENALKQLEASHAAEFAEAKQQVDYLNGYISKLEGKLRERPSREDVIELQRQLEATAASRSSDAKDEIRDLKEANERLSAEMSRAYQTAELAAGQVVSLTRALESKVEAEAGVDSSLTPTKFEDQGAMQLVISQREAYKGTLAAAEQDRDKWKSAATAKQQRCMRLTMENERLKKALEETARVEGDRSPFTTTDRSRTEDAQASANTGWFAVDLLEDGISESRADALVSDTSELPFAVVGRQQAASKTAGAFLSGVRLVAGGMAQAAVYTARSIIGRPDSVSPDSCKFPMSYSWRKSNSDAADDSRPQLKEKHQLQQLSLPERVVIVWGRTFLSSRPTRLFALAYFCLLHLLVFFVLLFAADFATHGGGWNRSPSYHAYLNE